MAGLKFVTDLDAGSIHQLVKRRAPELGYDVADDPNGGLRLRKGHLVTSLLMFSYGDFHLRIEGYRDGQEIVLEWSPPGGPAWSA